MEICLEWGATKDRYKVLFYVLYSINDLEEGVTGKVLHFADDTRLFIEKLRNLAMNTHYKMTLIN